MLYERTAISKKPELTIQHDLELLKNEQKLTPDLVFRDPYFLDFLGMSDLYSEKDLETSIIAELQRFIIEIGPLARWLRLACTIPEGSALPFTNFTNAKADQ
jgi:predicted nuclease of restriction endonuclease-like (RecB) superfamily